MAYTPPDAKLVELSFTGTYTAPDARMVAIDMIPPPVGSTQTVYPNTLIATSYGNATLTKTPAMAPTGFDASTYGLPVLTKTPEIIANGFATDSYGQPQKVWNYHTFYQQRAPDEMTVWGDVTVRNQKEILYPSGLYATAFGSVEVRLNEIDAYGSDSLVFGSLTARLYERYVFPIGITKGGVSGVSVELSIRTVSPTGPVTSAFGTTGIRYLTSEVFPVGIAPEDVPRPDLTDRAQKVYVSSVIEVTIFGDPPRVRNHNTIVTPDSADHASFPTFHPEVRNVNRGLYPYGPVFTRYGVVEVKNKAVAPTPAGFDAARFGTLDVTNFYQYRSVAGFDALRFGNTGAYLGQDILRPTGTPPGDFGEPYVAAKVQTCLVDGVPPPSDDSEPWVSLGTRTFGRYGGINTFASGVLEVTHDVRQVSPPTFYPTVFGTPDTALFRRTIEPVGIFFITPAAAFGPPAVDRYTKTILTQGIAPLDIDKPTVLRNEVVLQGIGAGAQGGFGIPTVDLFIRRLSPPSFIATLDGAPTVWNWQTYIYPESCSSLDDLAAAYGSPTAVLRNKTIYPTGASTAKFGTYTNIVNRARLVLPEGVNTALFGDVLVADRVRTVLTHGEDQQLFGRQLQIYRFLQTIAPAGIPRPYAGLPRVWRIEIITDSIGGIAPPTIAPPMVASRIRTIVQRQTATPAVGVPAIELFIRYIYPPGMIGTVGRPDVVSFRNGAYIHGRQFAQYGAPTVRNKTPELRPGGIVAPEVLANLWVSHWTRTISLEQQGILAPQLSPVLIEHRTRYITPAGRDTQYVSPAVEVRWDMPVLPAKAYVYPQGFNLLEIGMPQVGAVVFYPTGFDAAKYGSVTVDASAIWVESTLNDFTKYGYPEVTHKVRRITTISTVFPKVYEPGPVIVFPWRVSFNAFEDARHLMDSALADSEDPFARPFFGRVTVSNQYRSIQMQGFPTTQFGMPEIQTFAIWPEGWDSNDGKFGMTDFTGPLYIYPYWGRTTEDYIPEVPAYNFDTAAYGNPEVAFPTPPFVYDPNVRPVGIDSAGFGNTFVEGSIRNIYPHGVDMQDYGTLWIHPPVRILPEGIAPPDITILQVAYRIRSIYPQGDMFDAVCLEDAEHIAQRFRVRHGRSSCAVDGIPPPAFGETLVAPRVRTVQTQSLPAGGVVNPTRFQATNHVYPLGYNPTVFGNVKRAVYGTLEPYGPDMHLPGQPKLNRTLTAQGIAPPSMSDARIARPIRPNSFASSAFERPALTNPYGCRDRVIVVDSGPDLLMTGVNHAVHY